MTLKWHMIDSWLTLDWLSNVSQMSLKCLSNDYYWMSLEWVLNHFEMTLEWFFNYTSYNYSWIIIKFLNQLLITYLNKYNETWASNLQKQSIAQMFSIPSSSLNEEPIGFILEIFHNYVYLANLKYMLWNYGHCSLVLSCPFKGCPTKLYWTSLDSGNFSLCLLIKSINE